MSTPDIDLSGLTKAQENILDLEGAAYFGLDVLCLLVIELRSITLALRGISDTLHSLKNEIRDK